MVAAIFNLGQILLTLSILWLLNFVSSRVDDYSSVQVPTSWVNNGTSSVNISFPYSDMQVILLKKIKRREDIAFAFGFVSLSSLAIAVISMDPYNYRDEWSVGELLWVASSRKHVSGNATLSLLVDGNLVLRNSDGSLQWSTNTKKRSVVGIKLMDNGNLVLHDRNNITVWQSSDYSEGILLDGQMLMAGKKIVNQSYYLSVTSQGLFAFYKSQMYFKFLVGGTSYVKSTNRTFSLYTSLNEPVGMFSPIPLSSVLLYMTIDSDGHFRAYTSEGNVDLLADFLTACDYPMACGNYELCSSGSCSCPPGYARDSGSAECKEVYPTTCDNNWSNQLVRLSNVYHFSYVDTDSAVTQGADLESCRQLCQRNCSCKLVLFRYFLNESLGNCYLPSPVFSLINDGIGRGFYQSSAFIKIINGVSSKVGFSRPSNRNKRKKTEIIALSSVGAFIIIVTTIGIWIGRRRVTRRGVQNDSDDNFEVVPGMPLRFSYQELKMATNDFRTKLGEGGFGSVFEGQLSSGEKVAVKCLDSLNQGRKEFMAEVQTIGSIYHMNLVRLIGFCADKSNRLLVYEFMSNSSLDKWIFRGNDPVGQPPIDWESSKRIILDIAKGLAYLHEECIQRIVHLDIKPQNILLDSNFRAKVSDFGLSKFIDRDQSQIITTMRGTPGYMAPEWLTSSVTEKADVYSYGIVVLEVVCRRKNLDRSQPEEFMHLLSLFKEKAEEDKLDILVDKYASHNMEYLQVLEAIKMMRLAAWCLQTDYTKRPSMSTAVKVIEGTMDIDPNLDYSFPNPTVNVGVHHMKTTLTLLPLTLSAPR